MSCLKLFMKLRSSTTAQLKYKASLERRLSLLHWTSVSAVVLYDEYNTSKKFQLLPKSHSPQQRAVYCKNLPQTGSLPEAKSSNERSDVITAPENKSRLLVIHKATST